LLFLWPFLGSGLPADTPAWTLALACVVGLFLVEAGTRQLDSRAVALLAAIAAIDTALRLAVIEGIGGFSPIFFLVLCSGYVFGTSFGFLAGAVALPLNGATWQVMRSSRNRNWGHPKLIAFLERLAGKAKKIGWNGLLVGDLSQPRGGPMISLEFVNPLTGSPAVSTFACEMYRLYPGERTPSRRKTGSSVYVVFQGTGRSVINGVLFEWGPGDIFVTPSWASVDHEVSARADLFAISDRPVLQALHLYREEELAEHQKISGPFVARESATTNSSANSDIR